MSSGLNGHFKSNTFTTSFPLVVLKVVIAALLLAEEASTHRFALKLGSNRISGLFSTIGSVLNLNDGSPTHRTSGV